MSLSYNFEEFNSNVTGTVTNTTKDKWTSATIYYYTEMDGYYALGSTGGSQDVTFESFASADIKGSNLGSNQDGHTYEAKPVAVTYQVDKTNPISRIRVIP